MLHELAEFPLRPSRRPGESLAGFFSRHFGTNGYMIPKALHDAIATVYRSEVADDREAAWQLICKVMGQAPQEDRRLWFEDRFTLDRAQEHRTRRHWQKPTTRQFVVCPECLRAHGTHMALWDLPLVFACPVHRCLLVKRCSCSRPLMWATTGPAWSCRCGQPIGSITAKPAPRSLVNLSLVIAVASDLDVPGLDHRQAAQFSLAPDLRSTYDALAWLHELVRHVPLSINAKPRGKEGLKSWQFGWAIEHYPSGLKQWFTRLASHIHRDVPNEPFVFLTEDHPTVKLMGRLRSATESDALPQPFRVAAATILQELEFPFGTPCQWILHPALKPAQRSQQETALQEWWKRLIPWLRVEKIPLPTAPREHGLFATEEHLCIQLLNTLCTSAGKPDSWEKFRQLAVVWPPISEKAVELPAKQFLEMLAVQLRHISPAHRSHLWELAMEASGRAVWHW